MYCNTGRPQSDDLSNKTTSNDIEAELDISVDQVYNLGHRKLFISISYGSIWNEIFCEAQTGIMAEKGTVFYSNTESINFNGVWEWNGV